MGLERKMGRGMFAPGEVVELRQMCFTPGKMFQPGKYTVSDLPDVAFEMGLVDRIGAPKGQTVDVEPPSEQES
ncbi:hypothetical protein [Coleofasciculus sp. LEGE 07081]|uniref:hypothetical protein n=1 Tax=unclassified Coleofasciculus TaxID=2692782 RepID=UPI001881B55B|nr:hypothetical protein [Coleofasciculus sp. LEGE 07081]MBE9150350.1 hypothetical protein [Coleofasciculus sp. LEGE 07092]